MRDKILAERTMHAVVFLRNLLDEPTARPGWELDYFRGKLAEHPATGYRTWDEAVAERYAREQAEAAGAADPPNLPEPEDDRFGTKFGDYLDEPEPTPVRQPHQSMDDCERDPGGCFAPPQATEPPRVRWRLPFLEG